MLTGPYMMHETKLKRFVQIKKETLVAILAKRVIKREIGAGDFVEQHP